MFESQKRVVGVQSFGLDRYSKNVLKQQYLLGRNSSEAGVLFVSPSSQYPLHSIRKNSAFEHTCYASYADSVIKEIEAVSQNNL